MKYDEGSMCALTKTRTVLQTILRSNFVNCECEIVPTNEGSLLRIVFCNVKCESSNDAWFYSVTEHVITRNSVNDMSDICGIALSDWNSV